MTQPQDISGDGGVLKTIIKEGEGVETPYIKNQVFVLYKGTLEDGSEFDSNQDRENPFEFTIGEGQVIKGWDTGVATMKRGEVAHFKLQPEYAYGASGSGKIPPNATLNFEVELIDFKEKEKSKFDYTPNERLDKAKELKDLGNQQFKENKLDQALKHYNESIDWLESGYDANQEIDDLKVVVNNNVAAVNIKTGQWNEVLSACNKILENKNNLNNIKALFRRGQAYSATGEYQEAKKDFERALSLDPNNSEIINQLKKNNEKVTQAKKKQKEVYNKMFSQSLYDDKEITKSEPPKEETQEEEDKSSNQIVENHSSPENPVVFFDIQIGDQSPQRIEMELYANVAPKTAENFKQLCQTKYKGTIFHRLIKGFMLQGGDYENRNGTGGKSIYGAKFNDENFKIKHTKRGLLSMANSGKNTNGSQFFITFKDTNWLDGKHVVFGEVTKNLEFLDVIENLKVGQNDLPVQEIKVLDAGVVEKAQQKEESTATSEIQKE